MNYLVLRPTKNACSIMITDLEDMTLPPPFEVWAIKTGAQLLFVNNHMHKTFKNNYMFGSFTTGAMYGYTFDEMSALLTHKLGPSDRERYEQALIEDAHERLRASPEEPMWAVVLWETTKFLVTIAVKGFKMIGVLLLIPVLIHLFSKRK